MTTLNALFLPLLGGFLFCYISNWTSYFAAHHPTQAVLFFSASAGLVLLLLAGAINYLCGRIPADYSEAALSVGAAALPPLLVLQLFGWLAALLQSTLEGTRISRLKTVLALLGGLIGIVTLANIVLASVHVPTMLDAPHSVWWGLAVIGLALWASRWTIIASMPLSVVLVRSATLLMALLLIIHFLLKHLARVRELWTGLTIPLGDDKATVSVGIALLACLLGPVLAWCCNVLYPRAAAAARLVRGSWANELEKLIYPAAQRRQAVILTLDNHMVYVGIVERVFTNQRSRDSYLSVLLYKSGYSDEKTHEVTLTKTFRRFFISIGELQPSPTEELDSDEDKVVLPIERIVSASVYDRHKDPLLQEQDHKPPRGETVRRSWRGRSWRERRRQG